MMARLTEEMGELAREVNHYYGEKPKKTTEKERSIEEELGDVLFVMICMANSLNIDLETAHNIVMNKLIHVIKIAGHVLMRERKNNERN